MYRIVLTFLEVATVVIFLFSVNTPPPPSPAQTYSFLSCRLVDRSIKGEDTKPRAPTQLYVAANPSHRNRNSTEESIEPLLTPEGSTGPLGDAARGHC